MEEKRKRIMMQLKNEEETRRRAEAALKTVREVKRRQTEEANRQKMWSKRTGGGFVVNFAKTEPSTRGPPETDLE